jgi:hypothetical protein
VDGYEDAGIDAILFDQLNSAFYFVQSKWSQDGSGSMNEASCIKFSSGIRDILAGKTSGLNDKIKKKEPEIQVVS